MKRQLEHRTARRLGILALSCAALLTALVLAPTTEAGRKHKHKQVKHVAYCTVHDCGAHHARRPVVRPVRRAVVVPRRFERRHVELYRPYYGGTVYYRPHGHDHDVYYFPVRTARGIVYRPHYYCRGSLYDRNHVAYHDDRLSFRIEF